MAKGYTVNISFRRGWFWISALTLLLSKRLGAWVLIKFALKTELK